MDGLFELGKGVLVVISVYLMLFGNVRVGRENAYIIDGIIVFLAFFSSRIPPTPVFFFHPKGSANTIDNIRQQNRRIHSHTETLDENEDQKEIEDDDDQKEGDHLSEINETASIENSSLQDDNPAFANDSSVHPLIQYHYAKYKFRTKQAGKRIKQSVDGNFFMAEDDESLLSATTTESEKVSIDEEEWETSFSDSSLDDELENEEGPRRTTEIKQQDLILSETSSMIVHAVSLDSLLEHSETQLKRRNTYNKKDTSRFIFVPRIHNSFSETEKRDDLLLSELSVSSASTPPPPSHKSFVLKSQSHSHTHTKVPPPNSQQASHTHHTFPPFSSLEDNPPQRTTTSATTSLIQRSPISPSSSPHYYSSFPLTHTRTIRILAPFAVGHPLLSSPSAQGSSYASLPPPPLSLNLPLRQGSQILLDFILGVFALVFVSVIEGLQIIQYLRKHITRFRIVIIFYSFFRCIIPHTITTSPFLPWFWNSSWHFSSNTQAHSEQNELSQSDSQSSTPQ